MTARVKPLKHDAQRDPRGVARNALSAALLLSAAAASLLLALDALAAFELPGCRGADNPCDRAAQSVWGRVPLLGWPVSFVGLAYFTSMALAALLRRADASATLRPIVRGAAGVSCLYLLVIVIGGYYCRYCLVAHAANLLHWWLLPSAVRQRGAPRGALSAAATAFIAVTAVLAIAQARLNRAVDADRETSVAKIVEASRQRSQAPPTAPATQPAEANQTAARDSVPVAATSPVAAISPSQTTSSSSTDVSAASADSAAQTAAPRAPAVVAPPSATQPARPPFSGRYRLGPEKAPLRIVVFSDYQCSDCKRVEAELRLLQAQRSDIALWSKHFPFCTDCNRHVGSSLHPNACWAARAAEAAGILRGDEGFYQMHNWLFDRNGGFTDAELNADLLEQGYEPREFGRIMQGQTTLARVQADVEEAMRLGLHYTPMIFVNGVELRGWQIPGAVTRSIETLAAQGLPALGPEQDAPAEALDKYVQDWQSQPRRQPPADIKPHILGASEPRVRIVLFGDFQEPGTAAADAEIRLLLTQRPFAQYSYRHYPVNRECNPAIAAARHVHACRAARLAEAAALHAGEAGYWRMHDWLMRNAAQLSDELLRSAAGELALDADALLAALAGEAVSAALADDVNVGRILGLNSLPAILVNDRIVPRWHLAGANILERIIDRAAAGE